MLRQSAAELEGHRGPRLRTLPADCCPSLAPVRRTRRVYKGCLRLVECWARALALAQPAAWQEVVELPRRLQQLLLLPPSQTLPLLAQQLARLAPA